MGKKYEKKFPKGLALRACVTYNASFFTRCVAQSGSALAWGASGRRFKSYHTDQFQTASKSRPFFCSFTPLSASHLPTSFPPALNRKNDWGAPDPPLPFFWGGALFSPGLNRTIDRHGCVGLRRFFDATIGLIEGDGRARRLRRAAHRRSKFRKTLRQRRHPSKSRPAQPLAWRRAGLARSGRASINGHGSIALLRQKKAPDSFPATPKRLLGLCKAKRRLSRLLAFASLFFSPRPSATKKPRATAV